MGIKVICDKCEHEEEMRVLAQVPPENMHMVSPGNSKDNDRTLCETCYQKYQHFADSIKAEDTRQLINWLGGGK